MIYSRSTKYAVMALIELAARSGKQPELIRDIARNCPLHPGWGPIRKRIIEFLETTTIAELAEKVMPDRKERNHNGSNPAAKKTQRKIPIKATVVSLQGEIPQEQWAS